MVIDFLPRFAHRKYEESHGALPLRLKKWRPQALCRRQIQVAQP
jgi:hypothetical protein